MLAAQVLEAATAIAVSALICYVGSAYAAAIGSPGLTIPVVTAITGGSCTAEPSSFAVRLGMAGPRCPARRHYLDPEARRACPCQAKLILA